MDTKTLRDMHAALDPGTSERPRNVFLIGVPGLVLLIAFVVPVILLLRASFAPTDASEIWIGTTLDHYRDLAQAAVVKSIGNALELALVVSFASVAVAYPLTYQIVGMSRRAQTAWLILILSTLSLSDVLITFSWQVMLSRNLWIFGLLKWLGLVSASSSLLPSFWGTVCCVLYVSIPFAVLVLYPALSRLEPQLIEAARTMGASSLRVFFTVVVPNTKQAIGIALIMACVLSLGAYVMPLVLGRPQDWTLAVLISNAALNTDDLPGASALAIALLGVTGALAGIVWVMSRAGSRA